MVGDARNVTSGLFLSVDAATAEVYTLSLHDALPIWRGRPGGEPAAERARGPGRSAARRRAAADRDRKSTRLNSSHITSSYAVFCLKKKTNVIIARSLGAPFSVSDRLDNALHTIATYD